MKNLLTLFPPSLQWDFCIDHTMITFQISIACISFIFYLRYPDYICSLSLRPSKIGNDLFRKERSWSKFVDWSEISACGSLIDNLKVLEGIQRFWLFQFSSWNPPQLDRLFLNWSNGFVNFCLRWWHLGKRRKV